MSDFQCDLIPSARTFTCASVSEPPFAARTPASACRLVRCESRAAVPRRERSPRRADRSGAAPGQAAVGAVAAGAVRCEQLIEIQDLIRHHGPVGRIGLAGRIAARRRSITNAIAAKGRESTGIAKPACNWIVIMAAQILAD